MKITRVTNRYSPLRQVERESILLDNLNFSLASELKSISWEGKNKLNVEIAILLTYFPSNNIFNYIIMSNNKYIVELVFKTTAINNTNLELLKALKDVYAYEVKECVDQMKQKVFTSFNIVLTSNTWMNYDLEQRVNGLLLDFLNKR